jgi:hypothetical protein
LPMLGCGTLSMSDIVEGKTRSAENFVTRGARLRVRFADLISAVPTLMTCCLGAWSSNRIG